MNENSELFIGIDIPCWIWVFSPLGRPSRPSRCNPVILVETFVYFHWSRQDAGDMRVKLVFAKGLHSKTLFFEKNPGYAEEVTHRSCTENFEGAIRGLEAEWKAFNKRGLENLAEETGLAQWYNRIYRLACEPAHIADLVEYMPLPGKPIHIGDMPVSVLWAHIV